MHLQSMLVQHWFTETLFLKPLFQLLLTVHVPSNIELTSSIILFQGFICLPDAV